MFTKVNMLKKYFKEYSILAYPRIYDFWRKIKSVGIILKVKRKLFSKLLFIHKRNLTTTMSIKNFYLMIYFSSATPKMGSS